MADNQLADKIGELGTSLASIKEQVQNLGSDLTEKVRAGADVSAELKEKTDKALSELGDVTTRLGDLEKRAARERDGGDPDEKSLGDIVVEAAGAQSFDSSYRGMIKVKADRAAITSANTTVGAGRSQGTSLVPGARVPGIFGLPERQLTIRDLVMPGQTSSSSIEYVKETGFTNNAAPVAETTAKPYSDLTFDMTSSPVRVLAHLFKASRQILDDAPALRSYIDGRARYGLRFVEENQLLNGSGTGQNLHGLVPQATAFNPAFAAADETATRRRAVTQRRSSGRRAMLSTPTLIPRLSGSSSGALRRARSRPSRRSARSFSGYSDGCSLRYCRGSRPCCGAPARKP